MKKFFKIEYIGMVIVLLSFASVAHASLTFSNTGIVGDSAFNTLTIPGISSAGCLSINSSGVVSSTGSACGGGTTGAVLLDQTISQTIGSLLNRLTKLYTTDLDVTNVITGSISGKSAKTDALNSATTVVDVSSATAPSANQVLTATDSTHATWVTPTGSVSCQPGLGDGLNTIPAGTYLQSTCQNDTGVTVTISAIRCFTDNAGASTMNVTNGAGTSLLTGPITCGNTKNPLGTAGTQSATVTLVNGDSLSFTFVSDGTSKQTTWVVTEH